ncbi:hypothetical protein E2C01_014964 [Portunus trituberculatus]|uniref:Uncharacterized protein n=1 Tax=Portunus trituberculatus TaxID=210409 RepID=A0A5B7DKF3_PORTR|nr:hypothetical protein [Portunus trituberculatus]
MPLVTCLSGRHANTTAGLGAKERGWRVAGQDNRLTLTTLSISYHRTISLISVPVLRQIPLSLRSSSPSYVPLCSSLYGRHVSKYNLGLVMVRLNLPVSASVSPPTADFSSCASREIYEFIRPRPSHGNFSKFMLDGDLRGR